jgi:AcrR family transcriptional regulator
VSTGQPRPAGSPGRARRGEAREALIQAAAELTYRAGITATGVDAIVNRAGVTRRTLYQHFESKDALIAASLQARDRLAVDALRRGALAGAEKTGDVPVLALFDQIGAVLAGPGAAGCAFLNAALELGDPGHPAHQAALAHLHAREQLVAELLALSGIEDPQLAAELIVLVDGAFAVGATRRDPAAAASAKRAAAALITARMSR